MEMFAVEDQGGENPSPWGDGERRILQNRLTTGDSDHTIAATTRCIMNWQMFFAGVSARKPCEV